MAVQLMAGVKVRPTDNDTECKIIRNTHEVLWNILWILKSIFCIFPYLLLYIRKFLSKVVYICRYVSTNLCCKVLFGKKIIVINCAFIVFLNGVILTPWYC